ncbi:TIGR03085 family metal-binding protein [Corynebacterium pseudodiphtheriticum]|uniref:TIGR03085 family metal-binding protein n=1 Tax=Corynebacterium pseudodiphtheriticum TaxID=37637 RepID=A0ABT7FVV8_9CORY|nr:TIGR03085 family metal-binding protein [Corynebacterium pseudodiphtheriticum]MDK4250005.1 TIGR03085 family metal-binding protein [Corynebacterium pseudodiphtheriticum]MDK4288164.1 TIGR03085 family metal-binding protein [Corynebacterium pseudodiphtheriticum]MDK4290124.1 TIGR03085 family metal-binding protein [Corynebacterium pseudodiphtheriticum]
MSFSDSERQCLADLMLKRGPDAPTLCSGWKTADLAAHLWVREHRPDAALGMFVPSLSSHLRKVQEKAKAQRYEQLVENWRQGPPQFSLFRLVEAKVNAVENFVHHEDVRRAEPNWQRREISLEGEKSLARALPLLAKTMLGRSRLPIILSATGFPPLTFGGSWGVVDKGDDVVRVSGDIGELILWGFGRYAVSVEITGEESAIVRSSF